MIEWSEMDRGSGLGMGINTILMAAGVYLNYKDWLVRWEMALGGSCPFLVQPRTTNTHKPIRDGVIVLRNRTRV